MTRPKIRCPWLPEIARMAAAISVSTVIRPAPPVIRHAWFLPNS
jgi:hypothetical protein